MDGLLGGWVGGLVQQWVSGLVGGWFSGCESVALLCYEYVAVCFSPLLLQRTAI